MTRKRNPAAVDPQAIRDFTYQRDMLTREAAIGAVTDGRRNFFVNAAVALANETARADVARRARNRSRR